MSRESEKVFKEFQKFIEEHGSKDNYTEEDLDLLAKLFFEQYQGKAPEPVTPETSRTAEDWLELAENAGSDADVLKYAKKALKLDPNNLDAERMAIQYSGQDEITQLKALKQAVAHGRELMKQQGMDEMIGDFWAVLETRPYMRLRRAYVDALTDLGMMGRAMEECRDMLHLCAGDNLGIRFTLMHLYALLEREEDALALHRQFDAQDDTQMLLPLSMLYFKKEDLGKAEKYLKRLAAANPDTKKFMQAMNNGTAHKLLSETSEISYRPRTIDELLMEMYDNAFLFAGMDAYFGWAHKVLRRKK